MDGNPRFQALVLAGSRPGQDPVAEAAGVPVKALAPVSGKPMLARVIEALIACPLIERIAMLGPQEILHQHPDIRDHAAALDWFESRATLALSLDSALAALFPGRPVLIVTSDHPLLRASWITYFLTAALDTKADLCLALADYDDLMRRLPQSRRTALRFRDRNYSGCNMFVLLSPRAIRVLDLWRLVEQQRKTPWRIIRVLGWAPLLRYACGRLTLAAALDVASVRSGAEVRAVIMPDPLAAVDVDKPDDLHLVQRLTAD